MPHTFQEGDILWTKGKDNKYYVSKLLKIEKFSDGSDTWHHMLYDLLDHEPTMADIPKLEVFIGHTPIAADDNAHFLVNVPVTKDDLYGYFVYLEQTDPKKYKEEIAKW